MKVLQITTNYPTKSNPAFGIFMKEQVESIEKLGVTNIIFFSNGSESNLEKKFGGKNAHLKSVFKLFKHLLINRYDLIHCHSVISGLILVLSGGAFFNKTIISFQNDPDRFTDGKYFKFLYPFFNKVIIKKSSKYSSRKKVIYLPNGCNMSFFKPFDKNTCKQHLGLEINSRYILFVDSNIGRKRVQKRKDVFDEVLCILRNKYNYSNLKELLLIGIKREDVPLYMNASDLHLLTSDHEGSPNSVKECLCCNVPVVSTNVGNVQDLLEGLDNCYLSNSHSSEELASLVDKVLSCHNIGNLRKSICDKGFDIESVASKLYNIYYEVIG